MSYRFVIFGAPGAGKGTQSELFIKSFGIPHISTGDMFRHAISEKTALGKRADAFIRVGKLVPDEIVIDMVKERLRMSDCDEGFLLDGFPRTKVQAEMLSSMLERESRPLSAVVDLEVPRHVLRERLAGRRVCPQCDASYHVRDLGGRTTCLHDGALLVQRDDDSEQAVDVRLDLFDGQTGKLKEYYEKRDLLIKINGNQTAQAVFEEIKLKISEKISSQAIAHSVCVR